MCSSNKTWCVLRLFTSNIIECSFKTGRHAKRLPSITGWLKEELHCIISASFDNLCLEKCSCWEIMYSGLSAYRLYTVVPRLVKFVDQLTNWYVRMNRRRLKGEGGIDDCKQALQTLFSVLYSMTKVIVSKFPFMDCFSLCVEINYHGVIIRTGKVGRIPKRAKISWCWT